jgi:Flp pilus assembly pilin Flp
MFARITSRQENGQGMIEYGLILTGILLVITLTLTATGQSIRQVYCDVLRSMGGQGCECSYAMNDINTFSNWSGRDKDEVISIEINRACFTGNGTRGNTYLNSCAKNFGGNDFTMNVNNLTVQHSSGDNNTGLDVKFRMQDEKNGYHLTYTTKYNAIRFWKIVDGTWVILDSVRVPADWANQENDLQIKVQGDTFTAFRNGQQVLQASDDTFTEGSAGIRNKPSSKTCVGELNITGLN